MPPTVDIVKPALLWTTTRSSTSCSPPSTSARRMDAAEDGDPEFAVTPFVHFIKMVP